MDKDGMIREQIGNSLKALNIGLALAHEHDVSIRLKVKRVKPDDEMFLAGMTIDLPTSEQHEIVLVSRDVDNSGEKSDGG